MGRFYRFHSRSVSTAQAPSAAGGWKTRLPFLLVSLCFFLSGVAGLSYQTAWTQQFGLVFGTSELALATVLAAYMAGLALGAAVAGHWMDRVRRPVLLYAVLELGIGLSALAVPHAISAASALNVALLGGTELPLAGSFGSGLIYGVSSFGILLVPTALWAPPCRSWLGMPCSGRPRSALGSGCCIPPIPSVPRLGHC